MAKLGSPLQRPPRHVWVDGPQRNLRSRHSVRTAAPLGVRRRWGPRGVRRPRRRLCSPRRAASWASQHPPPLFAAAASEGAPAFCTRQLFAFVSGGPVPPHASVLIPCDMRPARPAPPGAEPGLTGRGLSPTSDARRQGRLSPPLPPGCRSDTGAHPIQSPAAGAAQRFRTQGQKGRGRGEGWGGALHGHPPGGSQSPALWGFLRSTSLALGD